MFKPSVNPTSSCVLVEHACMHKTYLQHAIPGYTRLHICNLQTYTGQISAAYALECLIQVVLCNHVQHSPVQLCAAETYFILRFES